MKKLLSLVGVALLAAGVIAAEKSKTIRLFDGKTLQGWEGSNQFWKVEDGCIVGGDGKTMIPHNDFLCTTRSFTNFVLKLQFKLEGTNGFVNSGIQIRSQRVPNNPEVSGYQCDLGEGWWGTLYDEARRNKVMMKAAPEIDKTVKRNAWNDYEIRAEGKHIQTFINGVKSVDYTEEDDKIPQFGILGIQVHGGGAPRISVKQITLRELP